MKQMIFGAVIFLSMTLSSLASEAQGRYKNYSSQQRIQQGVVHGKLTRNEARNLRMQQSRIASMKRMAMADGYVSPKERTMIANAERRANRNIYYQKHDRQKRF